jgi:hypothetical protein
VKTSKFEAEMWKDCKRVKQESSELIVQSINRGTVAIQVPYNGNAMAGTLVQNG